VARGWESKSVEGQVDEFAANKDRQKKKKLSAEQADYARRREVLMLAQTRINEQLKAAPEAARETQLRQALAHIEAQIAELGSAP
jgi:hypothetical protein